MPSSSKWTAPDKSYPSELKFSTPDKMVEFIANLKDWHERLERVLGAPVYHAYPAPPPPEFPSPLEYLGNSPDPPATEALVQALLVQALKEGKPEAQPPLPPDAGPIPPDIPW